MVMHTYLVLQGVPSVGVALTGPRAVLSLHAGAASNHAKIYYAKLELGRLQLYSYRKALC
jgi:hypothetical protein